MTIRLGAAARNAAANAVAGQINAGSGPGKVRIYTGSQPATPATAATGTLLVEIAFNDPAAGSASSGSAAVDVDPALTADGVADGTAGWWRALDSDNVAVVDGAVTAGEMVLSNNAITTGTPVTITGGAFTQPAA